MPRPQKHELERRAFTVSVSGRKRKKIVSTASARCNLTMTEKEQLRSKAAAAVLSEAEYIRRLIIGQPITTRSSSTDFDAALLTALNRIGNNVNQLTRRAHRGDTLPDYWQDIGKALQVVLVKVAAHYDP